MKELTRVFTIEITQVFKGKIAEDKLARKDEIADATKNLLCAAYDPDDIHVKVQDFVREEV